MAIPITLLIGTLTVQAAERVYKEKDGYIAFEVEDVLETDYWRLMTVDEGFSGSGYFLWDGPSFFGTGGSGILQYRIQVTHPGEYTIMVHNFHDFGNPTEQNDVWVRVNSGRWFKNFNHTAFVWNWDFSYEHASNFPGWNLLQEGENIIELSGRSNGFRVDRVHAFLPSAMDVSEAKSLELPLSEMVLTGQELSARFAGTPNEGYAGTLVSFDTSLVTLPEGRTLESVIWDFGDAGALSTQLSPVYRYDLPGVYTASLAVTDNLGNTVSSNYQITMERGPGGSIGVIALEESGHYGGDRPNRLLDENHRTRWSNDVIGGWIQFDLGGVLGVTGLNLAFFRGDERVYTFDVLVSRDGEEFDEVLSMTQSTGSSEEYQAFTFDSKARYVRIVNRGNTANDFLQITKARVLGTYRRQSWWKDAHIVEGWLELDNFGWFSLAEYPWAYHLDHGWIFSLSQSPEQIVMYNLLPGKWVWYSMSGYPYLFDFSTMDWVYLFVTQESGRWIYDYATGSWLVLE